MSTGFACKLMKDLFSDECKVGVPTDIRSDGSKLDKNRAKVCFRIN